MKKGFPTQFALQKERERQPSLSHLVYLDGRLVTLCCVLALFTLAGGLAYLA